jgi:hypothetical protein
MISSEPPTLFGIMRWDFCQGFVMLLRRSLFSLFVLAAAPAVAAEEPSARADLFLLAGLQKPALVASRVSFIENAAGCPDDSGTIAMSRGALTLHRAVARDSSGVSETRFEPLEDDAYVFRLGGDVCRLEMTVRLKTRHDGAWAALLLPKISRPSVPDEERRALQAQLMERLRERISDAQRLPASDGGTVQAALDERLAANALLDGGAIVSDDIAFEGAPAGCIDLIGTYVADQRGVTFSFLANLPGEINRFLIERIDQNGLSRRLQLTRHGCRLEITVTKSVRQGGLWLPVALAAPDTTEVARSK